jgi:hypothetical protein
MWVNLKPYTTQLYNPVAIPYTIGISGPESFMDQKRNTIRIRPGKTTSVKVLPRLFETTEGFDGLEVDPRQCKHSHETNGLKLLKTYSRVGCEMDCATQQALLICKCAPWHYPNNFEVWPICDMFGSYCFDLIMADEKYYRDCKYQCLTDCHETAYIVLPEYYPLDLDKMCHESNFHGQIFKQQFKRHFAFHSYKTLVEGGSIPNLATRFNQIIVCSLLTLG